MNYHKLLSKQINKLLPEEFLSSEKMQRFLSMVSESYKALDRDKELAERAFSISEEEYIEVNSKLKREIAVRKLSIEKLKESVSTVTGQQIKSDSEDLLVIARYLNKEVSKRKNAEKVFTSLITNMQSGILLEDENRHIVFTNQLFCDLFSIPVPPEALQGTDCSNNAEQSKKLFAEPENFVTHIDNILAERKLVIGEILHLASGNIYQRDYIPIFIDNIYRGHLWSYTDITQKKKAIDAIHASELKNRLIMNAALDAIITFDANGFITFWNPQSEKIFGRRSDEVIGKKLSEIIIPPPYREAHKRGIGCYLTAKENDIVGRQMELSALKQDGTEFPIEQYIIPVGQESDLFFCSFIRDISERKRNKTELERLSLVASANENGVVFTEADGKIIWCNEGLQKITGYAKSEIIGKTPIDLFKGPLSNRDVLHKMVLDFSSGQSFLSEVIHYRKDGTWFWGRSKGQPITNKDGQTQFFALLEDISAEKAAQRQLKEYEERLKIALANIGDNYWEHDFRTNKTYFSNPGNSLLGFDKSEVEDPAKLWWERVHKDDINILLQNDEKYKLGKMDHHSNEYRVIQKDGSVKWVLDRGVVTEVNESGIAAKIIGTHTDVTDQKQLEMELIQAKEAAEASTRAKEHFLANMSHEIRTPMNAIMGMSNQLNKTSLNKDQQFYTNIIQSSTENLLFIINDILDLSKIEAGKLTLEHIGFEPKLVVGRAMQVMMHKAEEKGLSFTNSFCDTHLWPVLIGDPYRLNQVLLNLISNAIKFTEKGSVDISCKVVSETATKQMIQATVTDTGIGMDEFFAKKLFQKFNQEDESVTRRFGGTGLGMSICKHLVELMGGAIEVDSLKGQGTTVRFTLEFEKGTTFDIPVQTAPETYKDFLIGKKILVADDNDMNRLVAATILKNYGGEIIEVANGDEAVKELESSKADLVLMDIQMPVLNGYEATRKIRESGSNIPVIAITANAIKGENQKCFDAGMNDYISKPYAENDLLNLIAKWLGKNIVADVIIDAVKTSEKLYNLSNLKKISQGNDDFVTKMINLFIEQSVISTKELNDAFANADFEKLGKVAHRFKPSVDSLEISSCYKEIREIERLAAEENSSVELKNLISEFNKVIEKVVNELRQEKFPMMLHL